ncbi:MAG TPA: protein kinase [Pyrinomonadaceae bacterium]|nr:protein kinase [Pyrinomonadaceae bacterium]
MKAERWQQVERVYQSALEKDAGERAAFLAEVCAGDDALRQEVESLLEYQKRSEDFIESPALDVAAKMIAMQQSRVVAGQMINHYKIVSAIGAGGMGEVYLAEDTRLERRVALKFLPAHLTEDDRYLRRFEQEARAVAALSHPNVCMIHEVIQTGDGRHCIVMEYVDGMTLSDSIKERPLRVRDAIDIAIQVASALSAAHAAGIIHRDIKLENIMIRRDGYVKILDFGLAKLTDQNGSLVDPDAATRMLNTSPGVVMGTVHYMSPEQARGLPVDARTDIWSLGVVLYEMVSGSHPFTGATPTDVIISIAERQPEPLTKCVADAPVRLEEIVRKTLAKERQQRYQTADDLLRDLKSLSRELEFKSELGQVKETIPPQPAVVTNRLQFNTSRVFKFRWSISRVLILCAIVAGLIATALIASRSLRPSDSQVPSSEIKSLAVLPMTNLSGDPAQDYFADGMTETLIAGLAKVGALRVMPRTSVMQYENTTKPVPEIAHELNVDAVVEGSVQRVSDHVKISVQLIQASTNRQLWTRTYDRELRDVLALQNEVARDVTQAVQIKLTQQEQMRLAGSRQIDPVAYDYYLRGKYYLGRQTKSDNQTAIEMFEKAVAADPNFAAGQAELAQACVWRLFLFAPEERKMEEKAFVAVRKALSLDPDLAEAHLAQGRLLWTPSNHFPHDKAIQEYRRALELNPSLDEARHQLAVVYAHIGLLDESLQELQKAIAINPSNTLARYRVGEVLLFQGKYEESLAALRNVPRESNPALIGHQMAYALFCLGKKEEASATLVQFLKDYPEDNRGLLTSLEAVLAASDKQERRAEEKIQLAVKKGKGFGHFHHTEYFIGVAYALMNKPDQAIKWLEQAVDEGFPCYPLYEHDANLNSLRQDGRFIALLAKLKQQWESYKTLSLPS